MVVASNPQSRRHAGGMPPIAARRNSINNNGSGSINGNGAANNNEKCRPRPSLRLLVISSLSVATMLVAVSMSILKRHISYPSSAVEYDGNAGGGRDVVLAGGRRIEKRRGGVVGDARRVPVVAIDEMTVLENELGALVTEHEDIAKDIERLTGRAFPGRKRWTVGENDTADDDDEEEEEEEGNGGEEKEEDGDDDDDVESEEKEGEQGDHDTKKEMEEEDEIDDASEDDPPPRKYWIKMEAFASSSSSLHEETRSKEDDGNDVKEGAIVPFDLSVNHLRRVLRAGGSPNDATDASFVDEEFLPVVSSSSELDFRWRSRIRPDSRFGNSVSTTAYRIEARRARHRDYDDDDDDDEGSPTLLWDSGKVNAPDGLPDVVSCIGDCLLRLMSKSNVGSIVEWRVTAWDSSPSPDRASSTSEWTKFAIGPSQTRVHEKGSDERGGGGDDDDENEWTARWISHPIDVRSWSVTDAGAFWHNDIEQRKTACRNWETRSQLPIFRAILDMNDIESDDAGNGKDEEEDEIASALLVVSGLGSFRASFDGVPLSSSGPLDPPLTDFAQRVSYRGFDVTKFLIGKKRRKRGDKDAKMKKRRREGDEHVVGISMGSGKTMMKTKYREIAFRLFEITSRTTRRDDDTLYLQPNARMADGVPLSIFCFPHL